MMGIRCRVCASETDVLESRAAPGSIRRRRACRNVACGVRITTYEAVAPAAASGNRKLVVAVVPESVIQGLRDMLAANIGDLREVVSVDKIESACVDGSGDVSGGDG